MTKSMHSISFVIPCLNEEKTLPLVLNAINSIRENFPESEIVIADNGSVDRSRDIAIENGARVVRVEQKGYGSALIGGISAAKMDLVCFADADFTYDFTEAPKLASHLEKGNYSIVLGNRIGGNIEQGAMPFLHRYLGTPVLSAAISLLIGKQWGVVKDCNSGFRVFKRNDFMSLNVQSPGMEFASEMLIKYLKSPYSMGWIPISLRKDMKGRIPHLKTWRDGMKHLLQILIEAPHFFKTTGFVLVLLSLLVWASSLFFDSLKIGSMSILGLHTLTLAVFTCLAGVQLLGVYLVLAASSKSTTSRLVLIQEDLLFWLSSASIILSFSIWAAVFYRWSILGFSQLGLEKWAVTGLGVGAIGFSTVGHLIVAQFARRLYKV